MSTIGPNDPQNITPGKMFNPDSENPAKQNTDPVNLSDLQSSIESAAPTALANSQATNTSSIDQINQANNTVNMQNIEATINICHSSGQSQVQAALSKQGQGSFFENWQQTLSNIIYGNQQIPKSMTTVASIINKTLNFTPNPKVPNSQYVLFNLYEQLNPYGTTIANLPAFAPSQGATSQDVKSGMNFVQAHCAPIIGEAWQGGTGWQINSPFLPSVFPTAINYPPSLPIDAPLSDANTAGIANANKSNANLATECNDAIASIKTSISYLQAHASTLSAAQSITLHGIQQQLNDNAGHLTVENLHEFAGDLEGMTSTSSI
jgi:hypothetical protein